ncbi:MAG: hypothetical protein IPO13_03565 [Rhodocyclaceae bacterium]|nr:hypothetical protein [Rhodocyclaceae bacterium]
MRRVGSIILLCMAPSLAFADQSTAFSDGQALGGSVNQTNVNAITAGNIQNKIPAYGQSVTESSYFQGGRGDTVGPGVNKVTACSTATPSSDPVQRQECDAINFLARNPDIRPQFSITGNDPMILNARSARTTSESTFQSLGIAGGTGSNTQCQTRSETTPAQFSTETCSSPREIGTEQCSMGRIINIDTDANYQCDRTATVLSSSTRAPSVTTPSCTMGRIIDINSDANFQCEETVNAYETLKCRHGSSVTVGFGQCTPGAWLGRTAFMDCAACVDPYMAMNISCGSDGRSYDVEPYRSYDGVNRYDYNWIGYPWNGSYGSFHVPVAPGQSVTDYYVSNLGFGCNLYVYYSVSCNATTCTPSMRNVSSGCNSSGGTGTGAPLQLPLTKTVSNWTSDQCTALQLRTQ